MTMLTERRDVSDFHSIDLRGVGTVNLMQGATESLSVEADEQTMPEIETEVVGGVLRLGLKRNWGFGWKPGPITFTIGIIRLQRLNISGSGTIRAGHIESPDLEMRISGSGTLEIDDLVGREVRMGISGSGDMIVLGVADALRASISGSGRMRAERLACRTVEMRISGSGDGFVSASEELDVRISGGGNVRYVGRPRIRTRASGSGKVYQIDAG